MKQELQQINKILHGDSLSVLKTLPSESIDCIVTSPPYWALRDYKLEPIIWDSIEDCEHDFSITHKMDQSGGVGKTNVGNFSDDRLHFSSSSQTCSKCNAWKGSLGQEPTIELFINHMIQIFDECKRVLKKDGTCWIVLGDTYSGNVKAGNKVFGNPEFNKNRPSRALTLTPEKKTDLPEKSLCMVPERFAIKMIDKGWILRNKIIWWKPNCMPSSAKDRFTVDYEYVYFFTKSQKYYFKTQYEPLAELTKQAYNRIEKGTEKIKTFGNGEKYKDFNFNPTYSGNPYTPSQNGRIKRSVWSITLQPFPESHFAVFPESLVQQCLDAGCKPDGIVLDPFMGAGTTALTALKNNKNFLGIELNEDYIKIAQKRIEPYLFQSKLNFEEMEIVETNAK